MTDDPHDRPPEPAPSGEPLDPRAQPVAGGTDDHPPAQGEGAPDSY